MKRLAVLAALAALLSSVSAVATSGAQEVEPTITVIDAYTPDYPSDLAPLTVCVDDADPVVMEVGSQYAIDAAPGLVKFKIYYDGTASCSDVPDDTYEIEVTAGDDLAFVIGVSSLYTFDYDNSCIGAGDARIQVASGLVLETDVYLVATDGTATLLAGAFLPGSGPTSEVAPGTYDVVAVQPGAGPSAPPVATIPDIDLSAGAYVQAFLVGGANGGAGGFTYQQILEGCDEAEPPPEEATTTSTSTPSSTTTTTAAVAPASASPATPVTGTVSLAG